MGRPWTRPPLQAPRTHVRRSFSRAAEKCGVSDEFVRQQRAQVPTVGTWVNGQSRNSEGKDGKTYTRRKLSVPVHVPPIDEDAPRPKKLKATCTHEESMQRKRDADLYELRQIVRDLMHIRDQLLGYGGTIKTDNAWKHIDKASLDIAEQIQAVEDAA